MPAINALLPIVAASNSQKDGAQSRPEETRNNTIKSAAKADSKGLDQDTAAEKRMQEKRFISVYEEGLQEQGKQQERAAKQAAERLRIQEEDKVAVAVSGSTLPPVGEALPITTVSVAPLEPTRSAAQDAAILLHTQVSQTAEEPVVALPSEPTTAPVLTAQEQQQAAAAAFHALVSSQNGKAQGEASNSQGLQLAATASVEPVQESASKLALPKEATAIQNPMDGTVAEQVNLENALVQEPAETTTSSKDGHAEVERAKVVEVRGEEMSLNLAMQAEVNQDTVNEESKAVPIAREPGQAERVRAWRGIDAQEMRSASTNNSNQVARQDSLTPPVVHSGQIQQFAQSLRLNIPQADPTAGVVSSERSAATSPTSTTPSDSSPWRAESPGSGTQLHGVRTAAANTPFAQTMQASNFGQPLGEAVGQNAWGERIAQRVSLMAGQKVTSAEIQLDPPELGAMTIKVSVNGDQASVSFHSPHALVRDALELSFPRLQEMMSQQGMQLVDAQVSDNGFGGQDSGTPTGGGTAQPSTEGFEEGSNPGSSQIVQVATGLIDFYA